MLKGCKRNLANGGVPEMDNTVPSFKDEEGVTTNADECKHVGMRLAHSEVRGNKKLLKR